MQLEIQYSERLFNIHGLFDIHRHLESIYSISDITLIFLEENLESIIIRVNSMVTHSDSHTYTHTHSSFHINLQDKQYKQDVLHLILCAL